MSEKGKHELRIKAKRDWSMLNSQIVGSEVLPTANLEKIETLKKENATLQAQNERLVKALKKLLSDFIKVRAKIGDSEDIFSIIEKLEKLPLSIKVECFLAATKERK